MIQWQKHRNRDLWSVPKFPYFGLWVQKREYLYGRKEPYSICCDETRVHFKTLEEAQQAAIKKVLKKLKNNEFEFQWDERPGNNAKHLTWEEVMNSQWLLIGDNHLTEAITSIALRFPIEMSQEEVERKGRIILKRHKQRFLRAVHDTAAE